ncbi:hypothetical protein KI387_005389, partial [Taxus chinensis]
DGNWSPWCKFSYAFTACCFQASVHQFNNVRHLNFITHKVDCDYHTLRKTY